MVLLRLYARALEASPTATHSATAGVLYGSGDYLAQKLEKGFNVQSPGKVHYNVDRTMRMAAFGFLLGGPILGKWYSLLHRMTSVYRYNYIQMKSSSGWFSAVQGMYRREALDDKSQKWREVALKVILDQIFFQAQFLNLYLFSMSLLEGKTVGEAYERCKRNFHDAWGYAITFWIPAQTLNFSFVPATYHAFTVNFCSMIWTAFLSLLFHKRDFGPDIKISSVVDAIESPEGTAELPSDAVAAEDVEGDTLVLRHLLESQRHEIEGVRAELARTQRIVAVQQAHIEDLIDNGRAWR